MNYMIFEHLCRTLDRTDPRGRHTRLHKRSILKHHSKESDRRGGRDGGGAEGAPGVKMDIRPNNMKVKFAGSLRQ